MKSQTRLVPAIRLLLLAVIGLPVVFLATHSARAAVELVYFEAATESSRIRLQWETATELDNAGFFIRRGTNPGVSPLDMPRITVIEEGTGLSSQFIPAQGDDLAGAVYIYYDENVTIGTRYYYYLEDIDSTNLSAFTGPREAVAGQTPTPSPSVTITTPTATPTMTPSRTPTSVGPSATPSRTATSSGGFQSSATPTVTGTASNTPEGGLPTTDTPIPSPSIAPVDLTLTAISAVLTGFPTQSPTAASTELAAQSPHPTSTAPALPATTSTPEPEAGRLSSGRIVLVVLVFLISGGLLTGGILYYLRQPQEE